VMQVNEKQKTIILPKVEKYFNGDLKGKVIAIWGLAFKPDTDDIREAPALYIIDGLLAAGAKVVAFDPEAMENVKKLLGDKIVFADDMYGAVQGADALVICTEWSEFRTPDFEVLDQALKNKVIFDGRNLYDLPSMNDKGYHYESIGRAAVINK
jgi:UDPglucose 6-dehydrogenase